VPPSMSASKVGMPEAQGGAGQVFVTTGRRRGGLRRLKGSRPRVRARFEGICAGFAVKCAVGCDRGRM